MNIPMDLSVYQSNPVQYPSLRECVQRLVQLHLGTMGANQTENLYELVSLEMEQALIERVLDYTDCNESRTAKILGISRGTLRQRRKIFGHYEKNSRYNRDEEEAQR